jgi:hypothetical protein
LISRRKEKADAVNKVFGEETVRGVAVFAAQIPLEELIWYNTAKSDGIVPAGVNVSPRMTPCKDRPR